jgi:DNA polymerase
VERVSDERSEAIRQAAGEVARHLAWLRDAGVREVPAPVAERAARPAAASRAVEGTGSGPVEPPPPRPASLRPDAPATRPTPAPPPFSTGASTGAAAGKGTGSPALLAVRDDLGDCRRCKLHGGRTTLVFGVGDPRAELMFVGEGPGADEDQQGEPFVGKAGQLLTKMIEAMGYRREQVYIANVVKCRPPGNRNPEPDEILACEPFLKRQIAAVGPKVIVALGKFAAHTLLQSEVPITRLRGTWGEYQGVRLMPTFHPAYLLRSPQEKVKAWEDLKQVMAALK